MYTLSGPALFLSPSVVVIRDLLVMRIALTLGSNTPPCFDFF